MNNIDIEKCDTVFEDITEWASDTRYYKKSAREVEARLFLDYQCKDEITTAEHCYILGRIYADALAVGGEDFFRV